MVRVDPPIESALIAGLDASAGVISAYTEAIRTLARDSRFPADLVHELERVPGFRHVVIHEYVALDLDRVVEALRRLEPIEQFIEIVRQIEQSE